MANRLDVRQSHRFAGIIWNTLAHDRNERLFVEVRDSRKKTVSFSALNLRNNTWLWKDVGFEEPWWISMRAVEEDVLLLTVYSDAANPDKKSVIAYDVEKQRMIWWRNNFSVTNVTCAYVFGVDGKFPEKESVLDLFTGELTLQSDFHLGDSQNFPVFRPFQYKEGTTHFDTVKHFLSVRRGIVPVGTIEYLEFGSLIIMSFFSMEDGLANYLYVLDTSGEFLAEEKLGEGLQGVGLDTFYVFSGHLIFVRNKNELTSFKII